MVGRGFWVGVAGRGLKEGMEAKQGWPSSSTGGNLTHKELKGHLGSWSAPWKWLSRSSQAPGHPSHETPEPRGDGSHS